jgi:hypothetical protein
LIRTSSRAATSLSWRQRIGQDGIEVLLQETLAAAQRSEAVNGPITSRHSARPDNKRAETSFSRT